MRGCQRAGLGSGHIGRAAPVGLWVSLGVGGGGADLSAFHKEHSGIVGECTGGEQSGRRPSPKDVSVDRDDGTLVQWSSRFWSQIIAKMTRPLIHF